MAFFSCCYLPKSKRVKRSLFSQHVDMPRKQRDSIVTFQDVWFSGARALSVALTRVPLMLATNTHGMKTHYGEMLTDKTPSAAILLSLCIMRGPERRKDISPVKLPPCNWVVCVSWQLSRQPNTFPYDSHCEVLTPNKNKVIGRKKRPLMNMLVGTPFSSVCLSLRLSLYVSLPYRSVPDSNKVLKQWEMMLNQAEPQSTQISQCVYWKSSWNHNAWQEHWHDNTYFAYPTAAVTSRSWYAESLLKCRSFDQTTLLDVELL